VLFTGQSHNWQALRAPELSAEACPTRWWAAFILHQDAFELSINKHPDEKNLAHAQTSSAAHAHQQKHRLFYVVFDGGSVGSLVPASEKSRKSAD
jgi:hypothetical protein